MMESNNFLMDVECVAVGQESGWQEEAAVLPAPAVYLLGEEWGDNARVEGWVEQLSALPQVVCEM